MRDVSTECQFEAAVVVTGFSSVAKATRIAWRELLPRLQTDYALMCHWDGYPIHPERWTDEFLEYDYIGAVWPWFTERAVGNSGFSLQSRTFLEAIQDLPMEQPEDIVLCRRLRPQLERHHGIRFAPEEVADLFSTEHGPADFRSFGFHGLWNMLYFLDDDAMKQRMGMLTQGQWAAPQVEYTMQRALIGGRRGLYRWIIAERGTRARQAA